MAPLPVNNTARYFVDYTANGRPHTVMFRYAGGEGEAPSEEFLGDIETWLAQISGWMPLDTSALGHRYSPVGTNFSLPVAGDPPLMTGANTPNTAELPAYFDVVGRSNGGRRVVIHLMGASFSPASEGGVASDYRIAQGEDATGNLILGALDDLPVVAIDGLPVNWKSYINLGYNAYWQRKARG